MSVTMIPSRTDLAPDHDPAPAPGFDPGDWIGTDASVPVADGRRLRYVNLDQAATTPPLRVVRDTVDRFLEWYSSVHRGAGFKSRLSTDIYEECREVVRESMGADPVLDRVVFTRSATESLNMVANAMALQPDDIVVVSAMEHHSDLLPWQRGCRLDWIETDHEGRLRLDSLESALERGQGRVRLVALTGASNVTGYRTPIHEAAMLTHRFGARISVDAAQLVAHREIRMRGHDAEDHLDFVSFSGHKLYAPYGAGVLVGPAAVLDGAQPLLAGGGTVSSVVRGTHTLLRDVDRHEAGSPNVVGAVAIATAMGAVRRFGFEAIERHERGLVAALLRGLARIPRVRILGDADPDASDRGNVVSFAMDDIQNSHVTSALSAEWAVGARDGAFCAHPYVAGLLARAGVRTSDAVTAGGRCDAPGAVRLSVSPANTLSDVDRVMDGLEAISSGRQRLRYRHDPALGRTEPVDWAPDFGLAFRLPV